MTAKQVTRRENGRRGARREDMRDALLDPARAARDRRGVSDITVERLAREAGISRTQFYMYFEDKGDLLHSLYLRIVSDSLSTIDEWWNEDGVAIDRDHLRRVVGRFVRVRARDIVVVRAISDSAATDPVARRAIDAIEARLIRRFATVIEAGRSTGAIDSEIDPTPTAEWFFWLLERAIAELVADSRPAHLRKVADSVTAIFWRTLYAQAAAANG